MRLEDRHENLNNKLHNSSLIEDTKQLIMKSNKVNKSSKTLYIASLIAATAMVLSLNSCTKENDNREKLTGNWNFEVFAVDYYWSDDPDIFFQVADTSEWTFRGTIENGESENEVILKYSEEKELTLTLHEDNWLSTESGSRCLQHGCTSGYYIEEEQSMSLSRSGPEGGDPSGDSDPILEITGNKIQ